MKAKKFGYARVSSKDQNLDRQIKELFEQGIEEREIYADKQSGKDFNRPKYQALKNVLREGDTLIIKSIDRLGRNYTEILNEWREITKDIKADIIVLDMPLLDTTQNPDTLTGTFISDLVLQILSYVAQTERDFNKKRQSEGIAVAKEKGKHLGRPKAQKPDNWNEVIAQWENKEITAVKAMELTGTTKSTFYKLLNN
ncbi:DNA recombinase [Clostridia bacterium]|nr:DNA recombinase [Clostridia bacterium]